MTELLHSFRVPDTPTLTSADRWLALATAVQRVACLLRVLCSVLDSHPAIPLHLSANMAQWLDMRVRDPAIIRLPLCPCSPVRGCLEAQAGQLYCPDDPNQPEALSGLPAQCNVL